MELKALVKKCQNWREEFDKDFKVCLFKSKKYSPIHEIWNHLDYRAWLKVIGPLIFYHRNNVRLHHMATIAR